MQYDLIIVGGGLVGAGFAAALTRSHFNIALVDAKQPTLNDPRLFALNATSCQFLKNIGVWDELKAHATSIREVQVSRQGRFGSVRLNCADVSLNALGYVIPAYRIEQALQQKILAAKNIRLYQPAKVLELTQDNSLARLTIEHEDGTHLLETPLVIGADGTASTVRANANVSTTAFDYQQSALVTKVALSHPHHHRAYERFTREGAIAVLPLLNQEAAVIWSGENGFIHQLLQSDDGQFVSALQKAFGFRLGKLKLISKRFHYPLKMLIAEKNAEGCVFLLGNAAHTIHPIAAQGFNLALYEAAILAEGMLNHPSQMLSPLDLLAISEQVTKQQQTSIQLSHQLAQLFARQTPLYSFALQLGMVGLNMVSPLKRHFINRVMGKTNHMPELLLNNDL